MIKKLEWSRPILTDLGTAMTSGQIGTLAICGPGSSFNSHCDTGTGAGKAGCQAGFNVFGTCGVGNGFT